MDTVKAVGTILGVLLAAASVLGGLVKGWRWWAHRESPTPPVADRVMEQRHALYPDLLQNEQLILNAVDNRMFQGQEPVLQDYRRLRQELDVKLVAYASKEVERLEHDLQNASDNFLLAVQTHQILRRQGGRLDLLEAWNEVQRKRKCALAAFEALATRVKLELGSLT